MVTPTLGRPRRRPYLEHDARSVRIALNSLRLAITTAHQMLEQHPEVAEYLRVMRPGPMFRVSEARLGLRPALGELVDALRSDGD